MSSHSTRLTGYDHILGIDPGELNGWALYYRHADVLHQHEYDLAELGTYLRRWISTSGMTTVVICERFVITPNSARRPGSTAALKAWGAVESAILDHRVLAFVQTQKATDAKRLCPDPVLKKLGWYSTTMGHANDAARHIYRFLAGEGVLTDVQKAAIFAES